MKKLDFDEMQKLNGGAYALCFFAVPIAIASLAVPPSLSHLAVWNACWKT